MMLINEISDKDKLILQIRGNILNIIELFDELKDEQKSKSMDDLIQSKPDILVDLKNLYNVTLNALVALYAFEDDEEAERIINKYENILSKIELAKALTKQNKFGWIKK